MTPEQMVAEELIRAATEDLKRTLENLLVGGPSFEPQYGRLIDILKHSPDVRVHLQATIGNGAIPVEVSTLVFVNMPPGILPEEPER